MLYIVYNVMMSLIINICSTVAFQLRSQPLLYKLCVWKMNAHCSRTIQSNITPLGICHSVDCCVIMLIVVQYYSFIGIYHLRSHHARDVNGRPLAAGILVGRQSV